MKEILINYERCKACGICIEYCPKDVFATDSYGKPTLEKLDQCIGCKLCEYRCPDFAIEVVIK